MYEQRVARLLTLMEQDKLPAIAINPGPTMTYLTGLHYGLDERPKILVLGKEIEPIIILPEFEAGLLNSSKLQAKCFTYGENPEYWPAVFKQAFDFSRLDGKRIGIEPLHLRVLELRLLEQAATTARFVDISALLDQLRMQKDENEIANMRKAVQIAQNAFKAMLSSVRVGVTEKAIASELVLQLLQHGCDPHIPFLPIVASGPNGANPHATPTDRTLAPGDLVVIDWGARYEGYCADITRTLAIGGISSEYEQIAKVVADANKAGRFAAQSGKLASQVDHAARETIEKAGYGQFFFHRTGHGIGMEGHEPPYIFSENPLQLTNGMTFTVEPGIYLADKAGVRIEDNVVVRDQGGESLTDLPRELIKIY